MEKTDDSLQQPTACPPRTPLAGSYGQAQSSFCGSPGNNARDEQTAIQVESRLHVHRFGSALQ
jgi:hypothetical protein